MAEQRLSGKRVLLVIAPNQFRDEELLEPKKRLAQEGAQLTIASCKLQDAVGMLGARVKPDILIGDVKPGDYEAIVVVGGMGSPTYLWDDKELHAHLIDLQARNKVVAGICLSGAVLGKAGVLKGKKATVWATPESIEALEQGGATYSKEHVVRDGLVVTADGPDAAGDFADSIVEAILSVPQKV